VSETSVPPDLEFKFLSGRPSVDIVGTLKYRGGREVERLRAPEDLARWFVAAGLVDRHVAATARDLGAARQLREALHRILRAHVEARVAEAADLRLVNRWAGRAAPATLLALDGAGRLVAVAGEQSAATLLGAVARDCVDLMGGPFRDRIHECDADGCTALFVDTSPAGRRRWCTMQVCGARSKMAAYRRRATPPS
jgi:predicted RNA-binding Zn ribbon-like protein